MNQTVICGVCLQISILWWISGSQRRRSCKSPPGCRGRGGGELGSDEQQHIITQYSVSTWIRLLGLPPRTPELGYLQPQSCGDWKPQIKVSAEWFFSRAVMGNQFQTCLPPSGDCLAISGIPWLLQPRPDLSLHVHIVFSPYVRLCPNFHFL